MAGTVEQIKSLIKAHYQQDEKLFKLVALQIANHEAANKHVQAGYEIKRIVEQSEHAKPLVFPSLAEDNMFVMVNPSYRLQDMVIRPELQASISRVLQEYQKRAMLRQYGMANRRKLLFEGPSGTGKTMTASVIARGLHLPLFIVQMDRLVTKYLGETSVKLRKIFDTIQETRGVYLFDEFDAIGADRASDNEVGEMRRVLNSFLQFLEQDGSESIIIAATNHVQILDEALYRRFDDVLHYQLPTAEEAVCLMENQLHGYDASFVVSPALGRQAVPLSQNEIIKICKDAIKEALLTGRPLSSSGIGTLIDQRKTLYTRKQA